MPMLPDDVKGQVKEAFAAIVTPVKLINFTQTFECTYCRETRQLLEEIAEMSDLISLEVYNFVTDPEQVKAYGIDKIPATAIVGEEDYGIRFYGIMAGYEFTSLVHAIRLVGGAGAQLSPATVEQLGALEEPVHLQVFVTPTCPYCPQAVALGYEMAYASPQVRADGIESSEFPHLAVKYQIAGVPRTVINENTYLEGAAPPDMLVDKIQEALGKEAADEV
ncbi:MAG: thioredoxin family protein [Anaerolineae bacterium]|nr:thioredoxin family protein [Anaerolineae bacterium]